MESFYAGNAAEGGARCYRGAVAAAGGVRLSGCHDRLDACEPETRADAEDLSNTEMFQDFVEGIHVGKIKHRKSNEL